MNYWRYRAGNTKPDGSDISEELYYNWRKDREQGVMNQKQVIIGDVRQYKTKAEVKAMRPDHSDRAGNAWDLCNTMEIGDIIFSVGKGDEVLGVGIVTGDYYFDKNDGFRYHKRPVQWFLETHSVHHGLQQGSLSRFNLKNENAKAGLENLLSIYGKFLKK